MKWHYYSHNQLANKTPTHRRSITPPENPYNCGSLREIRSLSQTWMNVWRNISFMFYLSNMVANTVAALFGKL